MPQKRFLLLVALVALLSCLSIGILNLLVDPFGIYRVVDLRSVDKPERVSHIRLVKAYDLRRIRPSAIVLGTSRCDIGIRMTHTGWDSAAQPRYNLGLDGATTHELYAYLLHAQTLHPLRQVVLGLDASQLSMNPSGWEPDFDEELLDAPGKPWRHVASRVAQLRILFNTEAALASFRTIARQDQKAQDWFGPDGQERGEIMFRSLGQEFAEDGPGEYFAANDRRLAGFQLDAGPPENPLRRGAGDQPDLGSLEYVRKIIAFCRASGVDLRIFITPMHAHLIEIAIALNEWRQFEEGKRALVRMLADDEANRHTGAPPYALWDFTGYSAVTTEPVPPPGSWWEMAYYWDSSHFKDRVGDWVLDRLFGVVDLKDPLPKDFGTKLTLDNIDLVQAKIRSDGDKYRVDHPNDVATIRTMVAEVHRQLLARGRVEIVESE
jgi:hypothetical protein